MYVSLKIFLYFNFVFYFFRFRFEIRKFLCSYITTKANLSMIYTLHLFVKYVTLFKKEIFPIFLFFRTFLNRTCVIDFIKLSNKFTRDFDYIL